MPEFSPGFIQMSDWSLNMIHEPIKRAVSVAASALLLVLLAGCANMADTPPGTPLQQVEAKYGRPTYSCTGENGAQHLIWSQQPNGQYAWGAHVDSAGNIDKITPLLTDEHFKLLAQGTWTQQQVMCEFGPPAQVSTVGLPSSSQLVWSYRYREASAWNSLMYVYFGTDGAKVPRFHPGPDPMFDPQFPFFM
jgi:hypothetical protein